MIAPGLVYSYIFFPRVGLVARSALATTISLVLIPTAMFYVNLLGVVITLTSTILVIVGLMGLGVAILFLLKTQRKINKNK